MSQSKHINESQCKLCGGACCKQSAGAYSPEDIKKKGEITVEFIVSLLKTGKYALDFRYNGSNTQYYIRPKHVGKDVIVKWSEWGGHCIHHTETGCELPREERPTSCDTLIPGMKDGRFYCTHGKDEEKGKIRESIKWSPYNNILCKAKQVFLDSIEDIYNYEY